MRFQRFFTAAYLTSTALALQLSNGLISANGRDLQFSSEQETTLPVVFNDTSSKLLISFNLLSKAQPDQVFIKLSNKNGIETSYKPISKLNDGSYYNKLTLPYSKLPSLFKTSDSLDISLIAASNDDSTPIFTKIGSIELTESLIATTKYNKPERYESKPEIHHIFQNPPKTVNPTIAITFASFAIVTLLGLILVWSSVDVLKFANFPGTFSHFAFIVSVISYEIVFFYYYLGSTIFQTITRVLILLGPTVWFGSKTLNHIGSLRLAGKR